MSDSKLDRLLSQLQTSGLQIKDNPLFQVISQLIGYLRQTQTNVGAITAGIPSGGSADKNDTYLTSTDQSGPLPNSRNLIAGTGISFDDTVANVRKISSAVGSNKWSVLTDGDLLEPELIYAAGEVIMTHTP